MRVLWLRLRRDAKGAVADGCRRMKEEDLDEG